VLRAVLARYPDGARPHFGAPTRCPACGDFGLVLTVAEARADNRCPTCGHTWVLTQRAMAAHARALRAAGTARLVDGGLLVDGVAESWPNPGLPPAAVGDGGEAPPPTHRPARGRPALGELGT